MFNSIMRVGVNVDRTEYARLGRYRGVSLTRVFGPPGAGIPSWGSTLTSVPASITPHVSFKDWGTDKIAKKAIRAHLDRMPSTRQEWLTYHHEPEGDVDPAEYRRRWYELALTVHDHPAGDRVKLVPIQTLQWTVDMDESKGRGDASIYHAGIGLPGMDCYANSWEDRYPDPADWLAPALRLADAAGRPLIVPELGAIKMPFDKTGEARAEWILAVAEVLQTEGCAAVSWWDDLGKNHRDFRLDDAPSRQAWTTVAASAAGL